MSSQHVSDAKTQVHEERPLACLLAEYDNPSACMQAAETLRDAGYKNFDVHTPFPVHGMDHAMGLKDSKLGWIVLLCGLTGTASAVWMIWWMNGVDYPIVIGGKPPFSFPSMVPVMFELTILLSAFGAFFGMLGLNRLPRWHDDIFESERFARFSDDRFFVSVSASEPKFDSQQTRALLEKTHPLSLEAVREAP